LAIIPPLSGSTPQPQGLRSTEQARAAQRAFFEAALGRAQPPAAPTTPVRAEPPRSRASMTPAPADAPTPTRILRPGSLLDIKV
jgi:hypothetical protein